MRAASAVLVAVVVALGSTACSNGDKEPAGSSSDAGVVQFRILEPNEPAECGALPDKPDPRERYTVLLANQCAALGPAVVVVSKAELEFDETQQRPSLELRLEGDDEDELEAVVKGYKGKSLAVTAFGKVLTAMPVPEKAEGSRITLPPIGRNDAQRLRAELK